VKTQRNVHVGLVSAAFILISILAFGLVYAAQQVVQVPRAEQLRYQLIGNEPIAAPDGRSIVNDWSVLLFKDRRSNQCYVVFARGTDIGATDAAPCPIPGTAESLR
jgi:hypothetical protein